MAVNAVWCRHQDMLLCGYLLSLKKHFCRVIMRNKKKNKKRIVWLLFTEATAFTLLCLTVDFFWKNNPFCHTERKQSSVCSESWKITYYVQLQRRGSLSYYTGYKSCCQEHPNHQDQVKTPHDTLRIKCGTTDERWLTFQLKTLTNRRFSCHKYL